MTRVVRCIGACLLMASAWLSAAQAAEPSPELSAEAAVEMYIGNLLMEMEDIKPLYDTDRAAYFMAVEAALTEFVDFRELVT